jgi:lysocardiolipin and lysophospholipid acyltransferase
MIFFKNIMIEIIIIVWFVMISNIYLIPAIIFKEEDKINKILKESFQILCSYIYKNVLCNDEIIQTKGKVDILIANHINAYDTFLILYILKCQNIRKFVFVGKKEVIYIPGFGLHFLTDKHIKLSRKWEEDRLLLEQQVDKLEDELIIIFPEGTRYSKEKFLDGQKFSKDNNLPVYDNLLVPKSKGLHSIYNRLLNTNKLGKIYDMSIIYKKNKTFIINRELEYDPDKDFKTWLLEEWKEKDILMSYYQNIDYKELSFQHEKIILILNILLLIVVYYQLCNNSYFCAYFYISIVLGYSYILYKTYVKKLKF